MDKTKAITISVIFASSLIAFVVMGNDVLSAFLWSCLLVPIILVYTAIDSLDPWPFNQDDKQESEQQGEAKSIIPSVVVGVVCFGGFFLFVVYYHYAKLA